MIGLVFLVVNDRVFWLTFKEFPQLPISSNRHNWIIKTWIKSYWDSLNVLERNFWGLILIIDFQVLLFAIIILLEYILSNQLAKVVERPRTCSMRKMTHKHFSALRCVVDQIDVHRVVSDYDPVGNWKNSSNIPIIFSPSLSKKLIHAHISKPSLNSTPDTRKNPDRRRFRLVDKNDGRKRNKQVDPLLVVIRSLWQGVEHLSGTLGMTDIGDFILPSVIANVVHLLRNILFAHICEWKLPKLLFTFFRVWIVSQMWSPIFWTSRIT